MEGYIISLIILSIILSIITLVMSVLNYNKDYLCPNQNMMVSASSAISSTDTIKVELTTGSRFFAGTDDIIVITFPKTEKQNRPLFATLTSANSNPFERNSVDTFTIQNTLGHEVTKDTLKNFIIRKLPYSWGIEEPSLFPARPSDDWFLARVRIWLNNNLLYDVKPNKWFTKNDNFWSCPT